MSGAVVALIVVALSGAAARQHDHRGPAASRGEFQVRTSCKPEVAQMFNRGVALLHAGAVDPAVEMFRLVNHVDVDCVMSWWGAALAHWRRWTEHGVAAAEARGLAAIASGRAAVVGSVRERRYLDAVELLYRAEASSDRRGGLTAYAHALEALSGDHPDDDNAALLAALALAARPEDTQDAAIANRLAAVASLRHLERSLNHPAVTQALLVAGAHPAVAARVLRDARSVVEQVESQGELLAAASDLFVVAGLWDHAISANRRVVDDARRHGSADHEVAASANQIYALLQAGRDREASEIAGRLALIVEAAPGPQPRAFTAVPTLAARILLERGDWQRDLPSAPSDTVDAPAAQFVRAARALALARRRPAGKVPADEVVEAPAPRSGAAPLATAAATLSVAADAWRLARNGRLDSAVARLQQAAEREHLGAGEGTAVLPAPPAVELLGELLLEFGRPAAALESFERVLEARPGRLRALHGAAHAAAGLGQRARAAAFLRTLTGNTAAADEPLRPEVAAARSASGIPGRD